MRDESGSADYQWLLSPDEQALVATKNRANRLGFAILLTFFREWRRFPRCSPNKRAFWKPSTQRVAALNKQLDVPAPMDGKAFLAGRTAERLRVEIHMRFGFRESTVADAEELTIWLRDHVAAEAGGEIVPMIARPEARCRALSIEPPSFICAPAP